MTRKKVIEETADTPDDLRRELEEVRRLQAELREQLRADLNDQEFQELSNARALESVQALREELRSEARVEKLAADLEETRHNWRQSAQAATAVVARLEGRVEEVAARLRDGVATPEMLDGLRSELAGHEAITELRLALERVETRLEAAEANAGLQQELAALQERLDAGQVRTQALEERLAQTQEALESLRGRLEAQQEEGTPTERLDRMEKEVRRQAERLDEELDAVFEQNRQRVGEMTESLNSGLAGLEEAMARMHQLEEETARERAETSALLDTTFQRMEALTGHVERLEDNLPAADLRDLQTRLEWLESLPRPADPGPAGPGEDPDEGVSVRDSALVASVSPREQDLLQQVRDLETRLLEPSMEALAEARVLRAECERLAEGLMSLSQHVTRQMEAFWQRLEG